MRILLTGASGFIGKYFFQRYCSKYEFKILSFINYNISQISLNDINVVIHFAAIVHQPKANKQLYDDINIKRSVLLAKNAKLSGVRQFIFMSSIAVYDTCLTLINKDSLLKPTTLYGKSKLEAEKQISALEDEDFKVTIVRAPMVYGYNAPGNIKNLMGLIDKVSILPFGKINNKRSFIYVGNLCALIDCLIQKQKRGVFLASDDMAPSTTELIEYIAKAKKKSYYLFKIPFFSSLIKWLKPLLYRRLYESLEIDNRESKRILNFTNPYTVEQGINFMVHGEKF